MICYNDKYKIFSNFFKNIAFENKEFLNKLYQNFSSYIHLTENASKYKTFEEYHKNTYQESKKSHYSRILNYNNKTGYIQIDKKGSKYFIQFVYNYAKLETLVDKKDLASVVDNMCYILRSVKFNDKVLESLIGENTLDYKEENYSLFDAKSSNKETFLGVVEKYETDDYKKDLEDEKIDLNN